MKLTLIILVYVAVFRISLVSINNSHQRYNDRVEDPRGKLIETRLILSLEEKLVMYNHVCINK